MNKLNDLKFEKMQAIKTAEQLKYSDDVLDKIRSAKTEPEITRILASARRNKVW